VSPSIVLDSPLSNAFKQLAFAANDLINAFAADDISGFDETAPVIASSTPAKLDQRYAERVIQIATDIKHDIDCRFSDATEEQQRLKDCAQAFVDAASRLRQFLPLTPHDLSADDTYTIEMEDISCAGHHVSDDEDETNEEPDAFSQSDIFCEESKKFYRARKYAHKDETDDDDYETDEWKQAAAAMSDEFLRSMPPDGQDYRLRYLQRAVYLIVQENEPLHVYRLNTIAYLAMPSQT
jgi:hypothetical protein